MRYLLIAFLVAPILSGCTGPAGSDGPGDLTDPPPGFSRSDRFVVTLSDLEQYDADAIVVEVIPTDETAFFLHRWVHVEIGDFLEHRGACSAVVTQHTDRVWAGAFWPGLIAGSGAYLRSSSIDQDLRRPLVSQGRGDGLQLVVVPDPAKRPFLIYLALEDSHDWAARGAEWNVEIEAGSPFDHRIKGAADFACLDDVADTAGGDIMEIRGPAASFSAEGAQWTRQAGPGFLHVQAVANQGMDIEVVGGGERLASLTGPLENRTFRLDARGDAGLRIHQMQSEQAWWLRAFIISERP